jgi:acetylglutamate kinase
MGHAGEVVSIDPEVIDTLDHSDFIPVISPVGGDAKGGSYNINADVVAGEIAVALGAEKLILLSDVDGVLDKKGGLLSSLSLTEASKLIKDKVAIGGMIPKLKCCIDAVKKGVTSAHIVDGRVEHSVLLEVFTDAGMGTVLKPGKAAKKKR